MHQHRVEPQGSILVTVGRITSHQICRNYYLCINVSTNSTSEMWTEQLWTVMHQCSSTPEHYSWWEPSQCWAIKKNCFSSLNNCLGSLANRCSQQHLRSFWMRKILLALIQAEETTCIWMRSEVWGFVEIASHLRGPVKCTQLADPIE